MGFSLKILEGPERGRTFDFDRIEVTIGRTVDNDVVLPDPGISRQHMSIRDKGGAYIIKDLGSSNGTKLNGKLVKEEVLKPGDVITAGGALIRFEGPSNADSPQAQQSSPGRSNERSVVRRRQAQVAKNHPVERERRSERSVERSVAKRSAPGAEPSRPAGQPVIRSKGIRNVEPAPAPVVVQPEGGEDPRAAKRGRGARKERGAKGVPPITRLRTWFMGLKKSMRITILASLGVLIIVLGVLAFRGGKKFQQSVVDHSDEEFEPGMVGQDNEPVSYGLGPVTILCRTKATFKFKYANGRATMYFQVASVEQKQEIDIQLNGMHVEFAQITISAWSDVIRLNLPRRHLLENEYNKISFINTTNYNDSKAEEPWGVQLLGIQEQPLPSPDKAKAEEAFKNAEEQYKNKDVALGNPYQALQNYRRARDYLELIPEDRRPEFYQEATDKIDMIEMELEKRFRQLMFQAEQKKKYNRFREAAEIYGQIMQSFKNQDDPHWQAAKEELDKILPP